MDAHRPAPPGTDPLRAYLADAARHPLLDADEEVCLGRAVQSGLAAAALLAAGSRRSAAERGRLECLAREGERARDELVEANLRLVIAVARRYASSTVDLLDLVQDGNLGLLRAAERFDPNRGFRFSTYGVWWIRQAILRGLASTDRAIRVPAGPRGEAARAARARTELVVSLGREPTDEELATAAGLEPQRLDEVRAIPAVARSLAAPVGEDGTELGDLLADESAPAPDEIAADDALREEVGRLLAGLGPREASVLRLRYGLDGEEPHSLEEVGARLKVTRERVRQIEQRALSRLRRAADRGAVAELLAS